MKELLSPKQVARAMGVSEASLKRWCDRGVLQSLRTVGGHRRLPLDAVLQFLRATNQRLIRPEILGLPAGGISATGAQRSSATFARALESGDAEQVRRLAFNAYLGGATLVELCDDVIAPAMCVLGEAWSLGNLEVFQERRAVEICLRLLHELERNLPPTPPDAPRAMIASLDGDSYALPAAMIELALREAGWSAQSYGVGLPAASLVAALRRHPPRMLCVSVSYIEVHVDFLAGFRELHAAAAALNVPLVVGGRALTEPIRRDLNYTAHCDALRHLIAFAAALHSSPGA